jgi:multidrug efflux pump
VNPADAPIMIIALTSDKLAPSALYDAASTILQQKLSQIPGVGQVIVGGSSAPAVRIDVNPTQLNGYGLQLEDVRTAVAAQTANEAKGGFSNDTDRWRSRQRPADEGGRLPAADRQLQQRRAVRLSDVAKRQDSVQTVGPWACRTASRRRSSSFSASPARTSSPRSTAIKAALAAAARRDRPLDRSDDRARPDADDPRLGQRIERTLLISIVLVVLVVFLFPPRISGDLDPARRRARVHHRNARAVMYLLGYSIDNLSLMALTISTGFVVDDAIVVLENITRYKEGA